MNAIREDCRLFAHYYNIVKGSITTFCDNEPVVKKLQKGWNMLRLRHTKGPDTDLQMLIRATIDNLRPAVSYTTKWVKGHQGNVADLQSLPREVALNIRMDHDTKLAYDLPYEWLSKGYVEVYPEEGCAVYIENRKVTSALRQTLLDRWHEKEALEYLQQRHGITATILRYPHWPALHFALQKVSMHQRATAVKAIHRHLPTQEKLFNQGRVTMCSLCPRCLEDEETNAHVFCCQNDEALTQRKKDWYELWKQLVQFKTSAIIARTWRHFLLPLVGLPLPPFAEDSIPETHGDTEYLLNVAIYEQSQIGWDRLLLGMGSMVWRSLQQRLDSENPKPLQRSANSWINSAIHQLLKFSLRCWKHRNRHIHGKTRQEKQQKALNAARDRIKTIYHSPPQLDPQFRSIFEIPLLQRLRLPLFAAEQWLSLIDHQVKVTKHNLKILLRQHIPINQHFSQMEIEARKQTIRRQQSPSKDTPRKARYRAVQLATKAMRDKLYAPKPRQLPAQTRSTGRPYSRHKPRRQNDGTITRHLLTRRHPP